MTLAVASRSVHPRPDAPATTSGVPGRPARLGPAQRAAYLDRLGREIFDVVVIGGGVVGSGVALDAATRGLSVALVEAMDIGWGTSSRSSKLLHGGLRYLEMLDFGLVREALRERDLLLTTLCPHLAKPVSFVYPLARHAERPYVGSGLMLYDLMGGTRSVPRHRHLSRSGVVRLIPGLKRDAIVGGIRYFDALVDDARHTLAVARTAAEYGAVVCTSARVVDFLKEADRVAGVSVRDIETGQQLDVRGRVVVNSTGVWVDEVQRLHGDRGRFRVRASKGVHLVVGRDRIAGESGVILRTEKSVLFIIPWQAHWIIGTTDTDWRLDLANPAATRADIDYLLGQANRVLAVPLTRDDIQGVYAGLRPLLAADSRQSTRLSREHAVARVAPGLVAIAGGKFTTYRVMAADAVDAASADLPGRVGGSCTEKVPLLGADGYQALVNQTERLALRYGLHPHRVARLLDRYGSLVHEVLSLATHDRELLDPLPGADDYLQIEAVYAATHEGALHIDDVLSRRTRIAIEYSHGGAEAAPKVAELMATVLGWSAARREHELASYLARVEAERQARCLPDDASAVQTHRAAPDIRESAASPAGLNLRAGG